MILVETSVSVEHMRRNEAALVDLLADRQVATLVKSLRAVAARLDIAATPIN